MLVRASIPLLAMASLGYANPQPEITPAPVAKRAETLELYSLYTTPIPEENIVGIGANGTLANGDYNWYWVGCKTTFTISSTYGACGNRIFTRCSGRNIIGKDDDFRCDYACVTHEIYENLDTQDFTPFVACHTEALTLLRTPTGSSTTLIVPAFATETSTSSSETSASDDETAETSAPEETTPETSAPSETTSSVGTTTTPSGSVSSYQLPMMLLAFTSMLALMNVM